MLDTVSLVRGSNVVLKKKINSGEGEQDCVPLHRIGYSGARFTSKHDSKAGQNKFFTGKNRIVWGEEKKSLGNRSPAQRPGMPM